MGHTSDGDVEEAMNELHCGREANIGCKAMTSGGGQYPIEYEPVEAKAELVVETLVTSVLATCKATTDLKGLVLPNEVIATPVLAAEVVDTSFKLVGYGVPFPKGTFANVTVIRNKKCPFPIKFRGLLPDIGVISQEDKAQLKEFYKRTDKQTYILWRRINTATRERFI